uniref:Outer membrane protein beta-barrel domain-containing protein n=1 Tax=uncultured bacterium pES01019D12 TaxID=355333 RepID=A0EJK7_9BACT|nr:hypothetical protein [uncultured bacterium pES01019D12]
MHKITKILTLNTLTFFGFITVFSNAHSADIFEDTNFIFGASLGYTNFDFPEKLDHDITFPSAFLMAAATLDKWQLSVNGGFSLKDANISEEEDTGKASRDDIDLTLGYAVTQNWALFTGYKSGSTKMDFTSRESEDEGNPDTHSEKYSHKGPYAGLSYTHRFERAGSLSFSVAYASLDATNIFKANTDDDDEEEEPEFDDLTGRVNGKTKGFSYALSWTMPLSGQLLFQTKFKINDYQQDIDFEGQRFKGIDETYTSLHVGLAYVF